MTITCDAIKIAYRQSKDGFVVSFAIHPQDIPADLANAAIGSQWCLQLVELDEHGNANDGTSVPSQETAPVAVTGEPSSAPDVGTLYQKHGERRKFTNLPLAQQAGMLCADPVFRRFIVEELRLPCETEEEAKEAIYLRCGVGSRTEISGNKQATAQFELDRNHFMAWKLI